MLKIWLQVVVVAILGYLISLAVSLASGWEAVSFGHALVLAGIVVCIGRIDDLEKRRRR